MTDEFFQITDYGVVHGELGRRSVNMDPDLRTGIMPQSSFKVGAKHLSHVVGVL